MACDRTIRNSIIFWLRTLNPTSTQSAIVRRVLTGMEAAVTVREKEENPALAPKMPAPAATAKVEPPAGAQAAVKLEDPSDAAHFLKDGRISQSTLEMFDLGSVLHDDNAKAMLLDDSKLADMSAEKVHTNASPCHASRPAVV